MMRVVSALCAVALVLPLVHPREVRAQDVDLGEMDVGWKMVNLDLEVEIVAGEESIRVGGTLTVELESLDESYGPTLGVNAREVIMHFTSASGPEGTAVEINARSPLLESARLVDLRRPFAYARGERVDVRFEMENEGASSQFRVLDDVAIAS